MTLKKIAPIAALIALSTAALPAAANQTYVENSSSFRSTFNGRSTTDINVRERSSTESYGQSTAVKNEWGSKSVTESVDGRNIVESSRFDVATQSSTTQRGSSSSHTDVSISESFDFSGFDATHRVTSGFDF